MPRFVIDCERMKYPNNGLYTYCSELGQTLMQLISPPEELYFYLPSYKETLFQIRHITNKKHGINCGCPIQKIFSSGIHLPVVRTTFLHHLI